MSGPAKELPPKSDTLCPSLSFFLTHTVVLVRADTFHLALLRNLEPGKVSSPADWSVPSIQPQTKPAIHVQGKAMCPSET